MTQDKQDKIGPFPLAEDKSFMFIQNPTSNGGYSEGYSIRYSSKTCGNKNGWVSLGTVKKDYIKTAKTTIQQYFEISTDEETFMSLSKNNFRKNKSTVEIDVGGKRRVDSDWLKLINAFIDQLQENTIEELEKELEQKRLEDC